LRFSIYIIVLKVHTLILNKLHVQSLAVDDENRTKKKNDSVAWNSLERKNIKEKSQSVLTGARLQVATSLELNRTVFYICVSIHSVRASDSSKFPFSRISFEKVFGFSAAQSQQQQLLSRDRLVDEELEDVDDVLEAVHVVAENEPIAQVAHRRVAFVHVAELAAHDVPRDVGVLLHAALDHRRVDLAQNLPTRKPTHPRSS
jgi:hypothetical protein